MTVVCTAASVVQLCSIVSGAVAACVWLKASLIETPPEISQRDMEALGGDIIPILARLMKGVRLQSRLNKSAAAFTAIAVGLQAIGYLFLPQVCWGP